jgi:hypothetical protein
MDAIDSTKVKLELTIDQKKELYNRTYTRIMELLSRQLKQQLKDFIEPYRNRGQKGVVLLDYWTTANLIQSVADKRLYFSWLPKNEALQLKYMGLQRIMSLMNAKTDCIVAVRLCISKNHAYINCTNLKQI